MPLNQYGNIKNTTGKESYLRVKNEFIIIIHPNVKIIFMAVGGKNKNQKIQKKHYKWQKVQEILFPPGKLISEPKRNIKIKRRRY
jgi:hypothetical protein